MADHSYYEFTCPCGKQYQREREEPLLCICGRLLVLDWSGSKAQKEEPDSELACEELPKAAA